MLLIMSKTKSSEKRIEKNDDRKFGKYPNVRVGKSFTGLGLFADEDIKKGTYIIQYVGKKITNKEAEEKPNRYLFDLNKRFTLDGSGRYNIARYVNHQCKTYNADSCDDRGRIFYEANRDIKKGEEITTDYGEDHFNQYIKPVGCKCVTCRTSGKTG